MYHISQDKRSQQSADWFFEALQRLMQQRLYESIKITDLVKEAQLGRTTFYRCFENLDDVLHYKCDQEFIKCSAYLHKVIFELGEYTHQAPFLKPFLDYWYTNFSIIELLVNANKEDIIRMSFRQMIDNLHKRYTHIEIKYYNYFVEVRVSVAIALLSEWVRTQRSISPLELVSIFEKQMILDNFLYDIVKPAAK